MMVIIMPNFQAKLLPNELGTVLTEKTAHRFIQLQRNYYLKVSAYMQFKMLTVYYNKTNHPIITKYLELFKSDVDADEILKDLKKECNLIKSQDLKKGQVRQKVPTLLKEIDEENIFFHSGFFVDYKENSIKESATIFTMCPMIGEHLNDVYISLSTAYITNKVSKSKYQNSMLNIAFRFHSLVRYMSRNNQLLSNDFLDDVYDLVISFMPVLVAMLVKNLNYETYVDGNPMIALPMSKGLCFGYITPAETNILKLSVIGKNGDRKIDRSIIENITIVINTYIDYDSMNDVKSELYLKWNEILSKHREVFHNYFVDNFVKIQNEDTLNSYMDLHNIITPLIESDEWKIIEKSHKKNERRGLTVA